MRFPPLVLYLEQTAFKFTGLCRKKREVSAEKNAQQKSDSPWPYILKTTTWHTAALEGQNPNLLLTDDTSDIVWHFCPHFILIHMAPLTQNSLWKIQILLVLIKTLT